MTPSRELIPTTRLDLHIGMPRTATTSIQQTMERLRDRLRTVGIAYLGHEDLKSFPDDAGWITRSGADSTRARAFNDQLIAGVQAEASRVVAATGEAPQSVFISSEQLTGARVPGRVDRPRFRPYTESAMTQVIDTLQPGSVRVLFFTRRQDTLMESSYVWRIQKGEQHTFARQFPYRFRLHLEYVPLIRRIEAIVGTGNVTVRPFETIALGAERYVEYVVDWIVAGGSVRLDGASARLSENRSYSQRAFDIAREVNPLLETDAERQVMRDFLTETYPLSEFRGVRCLGRSQRERILELYRSSNEDLFRRYIPTLPPSTYGSRDTTTIIRNADRDTPS